MKDSLGKINLARVSRERGKFEEEHIEGIRKTSCI